jgi:hypothetical protein
VDNRDQDLIGHAMRPGERLIWSGRPVSFKSHVLQSVPMALLGIPFFAAGAIWVAAFSGMAHSGADSSGFGSLFALLGVPFLLIDLALFLAPVWAMRRAVRTVYAMTDQRVVIGTREGRAFNSWPFSDLGDVKCNCGNDGVGSVLFGVAMRGGRRGAAQIQAGFRGIADAQSVAEQLRWLRERAYNTEP